MSGRRTLNVLEGEKKGENNAGIDHPRYLSRYLSKICIKDFSIEISINDISWRGRKKCENNAEVDEQTYLSKISLSRYLSRYLYQDIYHDIYQRYVLEREKKCENNAKVDDPTYLERRKDFSADFL